jgi:putative transposase
MKQVRQAFKFQLMRSKRTKHLDRTIDVAAHIWNKSVALHRRYYKLFKKSLKQNQLQRHLAKLRRTRFKHWQLVDSQTVQAVTDRLYRAWDAWFKHEIKRPPKFRARRKYKSFTLKQSGWKLLAPGKLRIQGRIYRFHQSREILGIIKTVTVSRDQTGRHYVSFSCAEVPTPEPLVKTGQTTGADFGLKNFLTLSSGERIESPQPLKRALRKLRSVSRNLSRKRKGSHSRRKARRELARLHRQVSNQRKHFHWKTAVDLVKRFDALAFEDLNLTGMKALWGRKVSDLGFSDYLLKQDWLCEKYSRLFGQMPRFEPSTKRMSCCGHVQDVALSERIVVCQKCSTVHDRDQNAAQSILEACRRLWPGVGCQTSSEAAHANTAESHGL